MHLLGLRRILNQLEHLGPQHHRTRGDREVLADLESGLVDLRGNWTSLPHIIEKFLCTAR